MDEKDKIIERLQNQVSELESIIALMPGHVYWLDKNNVYQGCNDLQAKAYGLASRHEIIGKTNLETIGRVFGKARAKAVDKLNTKVMESGALREVEEKGTYVNGELAYFLSQKVPLRDKSGGVVGLVGISFDIAERKRMEKELQEAKRKAELANQIKTDFIRNMEHDIRTPVAGMISVASYLRSLDSQPQQKELLTDLEVASKELAEYLNSILDFTRTNTAAMPVIVKDFDLQDVINKVINVSLPAAKIKRIELIVDYPHDLPRILIGDKFRVHRILLNLVGNAIKFTHQGYVKMRVSLDQQLKKNNIKLKISVEDTGIGIAKEHQKMIYNRFTRCIPANKGIYKGSGLGLWIVSQFCKDVRGKIQLKSKLNAGSIFNCVLPFKVSQKSGE